MMQKRRLAVTAGDLAGIGPEIVLKALARKDVTENCQLLLYGNAFVLEKIAKSSGIPLPEDLLFLRGADPSDRNCGTSHALIDFPFPEEEDVRPGEVQEVCGRMAERFIRQAVLDVRAGVADALVTAPIHKKALRLAGVPFPGHTEMLAHLTAVSDPVMAFDSPNLFVSLVTIHEAISDVAGLITEERVERTVRLTADACRKRAGANPKIGVLALNPHAGEQGLFGDEEERVLRPVIARLRGEGFDLSDPLIPDTAFSWIAPGEKSPYDGYVAMYHDQGLIPFKMVAFDCGVNVTLGLPIVRTSPDHGTAFDKAWKGTASESSLVAAIRLALRLSERNA